MLSKLEPSLLVMHIMLVATLDELDKLLATIPLVPLAPPAPCGDNKALSSGEDSAVLLLLPSFCDLPEKRENYFIVLFGMESVFLVGWLCGYCTSMKEMHLRCFLREVQFT